MKAERILVGLIVAVLVAAAAVWGAKRVARGGREGSPETASVRGSLSLLVVGVDGLDWDIFTRLSAEGRLPNLTKLMDEGAVGRFADLGRDTAPEVSWTSVVTGLPPEEQGIGGTRVSRRGEVVPSPLISRARTAGTLWTALSDSGSTVAVLGWPATWPVEAVNGVVVAPYFIYTLERAHRSDPSSLVYPFDELSVVDPLILDLKAYKRKDLARFVNEDSRLGLEALIGVGYQDLSRAYAADRSMVAVARRVVADLGIKDAFVFLSGLEVVSERFWHSMRPDELRKEDLNEETRELVDEQAEALGVTIERYYEYVDEAVGRLLDLVAPDGTVAVVSDHGFRGLVYDSRGELLLGNGMHSEEGFWIIRGPRVAPGATAGEGGLFDVAPTIAAAVGLAPPNEGEGRAHTEVLVSGAAAGGGGS
jgi:predicted AlkP superfamily phosphohydrolase/phosphomutase